MFRKYIALPLFLIMITSFAATLERPAKITIKNNVDMRNGPGSYYKLILRLKPEATVNQIDQEQQWLKVKTNNKTGWIPERSAYTSGTQPESSPDQDQVTSNAEDAFDELAKGEGDTSGSATASPAQVAAAVKGFAKTFTSQKTNRQETELVENFNGYINPDAYEEFRNKRLGSWTWEKAQSRVKISTDKAPVLDPQREQIGWGIANVIAQQGLIRDRALQQYLTHIALVIAENSHSYETSVQVYILDSEQFTGYACPNGAIFVSKKVLQTIESEAEFAFFIAHELAHVVLNHGMQETKKRETKIRAEQRFNELNQELDNQEEKYKKTEQELTRLANQIYEYTVKDRLKQYEYSADYWGIAYVYRAGYDPHGGLNLLQKIYNEDGDFKQQIGKAKWKGTSLRKRIIKIENQIEDYDLPDGYGMSYPEVWHQKMQGLGE